MESVLPQLIKGKDPESKTLIFALGDIARAYFEHQLTSSPGAMSSVQSIMNTKRNIKVLFLNKLQYLFMYLTKFEAESTSDAVEFSNLVIFGLDDLLGCEQQHAQLSTTQTRLANLIYNVAFKTRKKHQLNLIFTPSAQGSKGLVELEQYWREIVI